MTEQTPFAGKLALVTGASRGIGAATAEALGKAGAHVILTARTASGLEAVEEAIHAVGGSATIAPLDLTQSDSVHKLAAAVAERWKSLDIMVLNGAMLGSLSPVEHLDAKELAKIFATNVFATQALIAAFDPMLRRSDKADLIGITSSVGNEPRAFWGGYGASKAAFDNLLLSYADETAHAGKLRVQLIDPGATRTRMRQNAFPGEEPATLKTPDVVAAAIIERIKGEATTGGRFRVEG
ncbi:MAG: SDR family NAD(P)-dependent oxidoreductase [Pseudomonadota bacterium]|nr:SDR family NAD(P)-dependent oxidoreductase [Pseudomonadota bacterium]